MKRLFVALKIFPDAGFLSRYRNLKAGLAHEHIKWVEEHNIHITLKFFGETDERKIPGICSVLHDRSEITSPFGIKLSGLGIFGSAYAPKVVWTGIEPYEQISLLMKNIHHDLLAIGYEADRQNLVPHLTLGRIKLLRDKIIFRSTLDKFRTISSEPVHLSEMVLYESILHREGPEYIVLDRFQFKKELP